MAFLGLGAAAGAGAASGAAAGGAAAATAATTTAAAAGGAAAGSAAAAAAAGKAALALSSTAGAAGVSSGITATQIGLGLSAASAGMGLVQSSNQMTAANNQAKARDTYARLNEAQTQNESQRRLASVISMNNNYAAATGLNANAGSLLQIRKSADRAAERDQLGALGRRLFEQSQITNALFSTRSQAAGQGFGGVVDFGKNVFDVLSSD